jgi:hypothetical protein
MYYFLEFPENIKRITNESMKHGTIPYTVKAKFNEFTNEMVKSEFIRKMKMEFELFGRWKNVR